MRRSLTLFSIVARAVAIAALLISQLLAGGALPAPRQPILFADRVMPTEGQPSQAPLDQAAVAAVQQWRFTPALLNGAAVPVLMT